MLKDKNVLFAEVWTGLVHWTKDKGNVVIQLFKRVSKHTFNNQYLARCELHKMKISQIDIGRVGLSAKSPSAEDYSAIGKQLFEAFQVCLCPNLLRTALLWLYHLPNSS